MIDEELPGDGPEGALARLVRAFRLGYSRSFIAGLVAGHPQPTTLLALVEIGGRLGLKITPGRTEPGELVSIGLPAVVHMSAGSGAGFGVLEGVTEVGYKVWDTVNAARVIDRDTFEDAWSGIVCLVERTGDGITEPGARRRRIAETVTRADPPALVGGWGSTVARALILVPLAALVARSVVLAPNDRAVAVVIVVAALVGLVLSAFTVSALGTGAGARICGRGKLVDCRGVLTSRYSRVFGISLADIGFAFYASVILLLAAGALSRDPQVFRAAALAFLVASPAALLLGYLQVKLRKLCLLCLGIHSVNIVVAGVALAQWRNELFDPSGLVAEMVWLVALGALMLFVAVPYWHKTKGVAFLSRRFRRMSTSPFASLAELVTQPPTRIEGWACGVRMNKGTAAHEIVLFAHPSCNRCDPMIRELAILAAGTRVAAYVAFAPRDPVESDRAACAVLVACGLAGGAEAMLDAYSAAKQDLPAFFARPEVRALAATGMEPATLHQAMGEARAIVERAEALADRYVEGTPWVFFDARSYTGPLAHIAWLLEHHPKLLHEAPLEART